MYNPDSMGIPGYLTEDLLAPGNSEAPDWESHYGKTFRWCYVPRENFLGSDEEYEQGPQIGLVANLGSDFYDWEDAESHPYIQEWKNDWVTLWKTIPAYKQNQIMAAIERVRGLHKRVNGPYDDYMCEHCYVDEYRYYQYPCPTLKALGGAEW